jgi:hypothetical protein
VALTTAPDFNDGILTPAKLQQLSDAINERTIQYVLKTATEGVTSSATLQNDDVLLASVAAGCTYTGILVAYLQSAANAAGDIRIGFNFPAGATCHFGSAGPDDALASGSVQTGIWLPRLSATAGTTAINFGTSTAGTTAWVGVELVVGGTGGTLNVMFAQGASNVNESRMLLGSTFRVWRVS